MTRLEEILARKREEVRASKARVSEASLREQIRSAPPARGFRAAVASRGRANVIAEIKRASPSVGAIAPGADAVEAARGYAQGGAAAISVLTDGPGFGGSLDDLRSVRSAVATPLLRKDFVVDAYQLLEARAAGADAALLIVAALDDQALRELLRVAAELQLDVLVEVHDEAEADRALAAGATLIGINNRNLKTFEVDLATSERVLPKVARAAVGVVESGVRSAADGRRLGRAGASTFLIGEALMRSGDPARFLRELESAVATSFRLKVCGITRAEDAAAAVDAGADAIGLNFWSASKRRVDRAAAARIASALPPGVRAVGVFVNADAREIGQTMAEVPLFAIQLHGDEPASLVASLRAPVIRAVRVASTASVEEAADFPAAAFLLDAAAPGYGGGGQPFDWSIAAGAPAKLHRPVILAGGLNTQNVGEAIRTVKPDAVDVASGVEAAPGVKDHKLLRSFASAALEAFGR